jgi:hypothetical protein
MPSGGNGMRQVMRALDKQVQSAIQAGISSTYFAANEIAEAGRDEAKRLVDHPGTNRPYVDKKGRQRMSSHPGEAPASGPQYDLYHTIISRPVSKKNQNPASAMFGSTAEYALNLEFGAGRVAPRPFMRPAIKFAQIVAYPIVKRKWNAAVKKKIAKMPSPPTINITL